MTFLPVYYQHGDHLPEPSTTSFSKVGDIVKLPNPEGDLETLVIKSIEIYDGQVIIKVESI